MEVFSDLFLERCVKLTYVLLLAQCIEKCRSTYSDASILRLLPKCLYGKALSWFQSNQCQGQDIFKDLSILLRALVAKFKKPLLDQPPCQPSATALPSCRHCNERFAYRDKLHQHLRQNSCILSSKTSGRCPAPPATAAATIHPSVPPPVIQQSHLLAPKSSTIVPKLASKSRSKIASKLDSRLDCRSSTQYTALQSNRAESNRLCSMRFDKVPRNPRLLQRRHLL